MKYALVTTTINVPLNLDNYVKDLADHNEHDTLVVVAGDKKTPAETRGFCEGLTQRYGIPVEYLSPENQHDRERKYSTFLGWNNIQRRNMAILYAYRAGAEVIVTIDDDNYMVDSGYLDRHAMFETGTPVEVISSANGWYNICERLPDHNGNRFFPRGYSFEQRRNTEFARTTSTLHAHLPRAVNAGLWLGDPDVDAVTRIASAPSVEDGVFSRFGLAVGTYAPFNSQNTALRREVIPAYCMVSGVGRYDDIVASYIVKRIADHFGALVAFGEPVVRQTRNPHNLFGDLRAELTGMEMIDRFVRELRTVDLMECASWQTAAERLVERIRNVLKDENGSLYAAQWGFLNNVCRSYEAWWEVLNA